MGSLVKGIGNAVGSVVKTISPIASIASNFIPGGSVLSGAIKGIGAVGAMANNQAAQNTAQGAANAGMASENKVGQYQTGQYLGRNPSFLNATATNAGMNPDGTWNANYNPYAGTASSIQGGLQKQAQDIYSTAPLTGQLRNHVEATAGQYDNSVDAVKHDLAGSGFAGSSAADAQIGGIRRAQASDNAGFSRNLMTDLMNKQQGFEASGTQNTNALLEQGAQQEQGNLAGYGNTLQNLAGSGVGTLGGVSQQYEGRAGALNTANQADTAAAASAGLQIPNLFAGVGGTLGKWLNPQAKRTQSTSTGTTGAQSPSPTPNSNVYLPGYGFGNKSNPGYTPSFMGL